MKFMHKCRGSISVFLICILIPMVVFEGLLIDGTKLISAKSAASDAGQMAMNGALADYNAVIKDVYGIFAISETPDELEANMEKYYLETLNVANIDANGQTLEDKLKEAVTFLNLSGNVTSAKGVEGSTLDNTEVLKSQMLYYAKYRGIVSLSMGLLQKFTAFSSLDKQQKAVEGKLNYDKELADVQECLQEAYDNINKYLNSPVAVSTVKAAKQKADENYDNVCLCLAYYAVLESVGFKTIYDESDSGIPDISTTTVSASGMTEEEQMAFVDAVLDDYTANGDSSYDSWKEQMDGYIQGLGQEPTDLEALQDRCKLLLEMHNKGWQGKDLDPAGKLTNAQYIVKALNCLEKLASTLDDENEKETRKSLYKEIYDDIADYNMITYLGKCEGWLESRINSDAKEVYDALSGASDSLDSASDMLQDAYDALDDAKEKAQNLENLKDTWSDSVEKLPDGETKTSMATEVATRTEELDVEKLEALQAIISDMKTKCDSAKEAIEGITFDSHKLYKTSGDNYFDKYKDVIDDIAASKDTSKITEWKNQLKNLHYVTQEITLEDSDLSSTRITLNEFYMYLSGICTKSEVEDSTEKKDAKDQKKQIMDSTTMEEPDDMPEGTYAEIGDNMESADGDVSTSGKDSKVSDSAVEKSGNVAGLFSGLTDILVNARNDIILEEYATEMFSCYTTGKDDKGTLSLSGNDFKSGTIPSVNYRSEVEYILYGQTSAKSNINMARGSIFGVRFVLNLIYAFTGDAEIKAETLQLATAIAGWTGFGVPIVQNVLTIGLALAESVLDTTNLMAGKEVVIYKTKTTWTFKMSNITKELVQNLATAAADKALDQLNEWIENAATNINSGIDGLSANVQNLIDEKVDELTSTAVTTVFTPIQNMCLSVVPDIGLTDANIDSYVEQVFDNMATAIGVDGDIESYAANDIEKYAAKICLQEFEKYKESLKQALKKDRDDTKIGTLDHKSIIDWFDNTRDSVSSSIIAKIKDSEYMNAFKEQMNTYGEQLQGVVNDSADKLSGAAEESVESIKSKMSDTISNWSTGKGCNSNVSLDTKKSTTSTGTGLTMSYKEYLKLFVLLGLINNESGMIQRMGLLMEMNAQASSNAEAQSFTLAGSYTMVEMTADVSVSTSFLRNVPNYFDGVDVPDALDDEGKYTFTYKSVLGY